MTNCEGCKYYRLFSSTNPNLKCCHYLVDTDKPRNSDPKNCKRKDYGKREKVKKSVPFFPKKK